MEIHTAHLDEVNSNFYVCMSMCVCECMCNSTYDNAMCKGRIGELYHFI